MCEVHLGQDSDIKSRPSRPTSHAEMSSGVPGLSQRVGTCATKVAPVVYGMATIVKDVRATRGGIYSEWERVADT